jgi:hypothetical protein
MAATAQSAIHIDEESGEWMIDIPQEVMDEIGITPSDIILWRVDENGQVSIKKKSE